MFTTTTQPYIERLSNTLTLTNVSTHEDIERVATFNAEIHGDEGVGAMTRELILHHPDTRPEHWLYIEDTNTGQIVSSLCLIPWHFRLGTAQLKAGEMGIVGTHVDYRRQGLIRAMDHRFKTLLAEGNFHLSHIQGIPYYYRQFGYEYAIPLEGGWEIALRHIPDALPEEPSHTLRLATTGDIPVLMHGHDALTAPLGLTSYRSADVWRYLLVNGPKTAMNSEFWLVLDKAGVPVGHVHIELGGFGTGLNVREASPLSHKAAVATLRHLKTLAIERNKPYIRFHPAPNNDLIAVAQHWNAVDRGHYPWQICLTDVAHLLRALSPVFEQRLAASQFVKLTETVTINLYREAFDLRFEAGMLRSVDAVGFRPWEGTNNIPPNAFVQLVMGYRTREQLQAQYPDLGIRGQHAYLFDVLFPKTSSFLYTTY